MYQNRTEIGTENRFGTLFFNEPKPKPRTQIL